MNLLADSAIKTPIITFTLNIYLFYHLNFTPQLFNISFQTL